ncbi:aspartate-semialdehyde dehydrogenase [Pseudomonas lundensis]|uniref:aspartate-semialdehyde dehydrogenase n=1 Tax=Pseudomonas lundensis TaxID=86185 RepID=UPI001890BC86|nr:aspartate-semialdehyde dehydrogenase [Pseudomonas lundensis]QOF92517.1 aspartate-semialdehyde dehydrogenase [Pseudomonas lundensis]
MLPPILPISVVPVTSQQDPVRPRPDIPPVVPAQASSGDSTINLKNQDPDQASLLLCEEQRRQQDKRRRESRDQAQEVVIVPGDELNEDNTVPVSPLIDGAPRQGQWVDIEV